MIWFATFWFILMVVFLAMESSTVSLISIWFAAGSLVAMVTALLGGELWL